MLTLTKVNDQVVSVRMADGLLVGNLKWIGKAWKFKALGFDDEGNVVPGGGPLTDRHNTSIAQADAVEVSAKLLPP